MIFGSMKREFYLQHYDRNDGPSKPQRIIESDGRNTQA